jgi:hypothetical protein
MTLAQAEIALARALRHRSNQWALGDPAAIATADAKVAGLSRLVDKLRPPPQPIEVQGWRDWHSRTHEFPWLKGITSWLRNKQTP